MRFRSPVGGYSAGGPVGGIIRNVYTVTGLLPAHLACLPSSDPPLMG